MHFHAFYGFEADEVARKLSVEQARHSLNSSTTKVSTARLKRR